MNLAVFDLRSITSTKVEEQELCIQCTTTLSFTNWYQHCVCVCEGGRGDEEWEGVLLVMYLHDLVSEMEAVSTSDCEGGRGGRGGREGRERGREERAVHSCHQHHPGQEHREPG